MTPVWFILNRSMAMSLSCLLRNLASAGESGMYENRMDEKQTVMIPKKMNIVYSSSQKSVLRGQETTLGAHLVWFKSEWQLRKSPCDQAAELYRISSRLCANVAWKGTTYHVGKAVHGVPIRHTQRLLPATPEHLRNGDEARSDTCLESTQPEPSHK